MKNANLNNENKTINVNGNKSNSPQNIANNNNNKRNVTRNLQPSTLTELIKSKLELNL